MATIKSYTDLEQSKKLVEILPLESADMFYEEVCNLPKAIVGNYILHNQCMEDRDYKKLSNPVLSPAWSLAALLSVLPKKYYPIKDHETDLILGKPKDKWCLLYWDATGMQDGEQILEDNPVDACYEMILKLHELKML